MGFQADLNRKASYGKYKIVVIWDRRRRFEKRNIVEKVIGTGKQAEQTCFLELPNRLNLSVLVSKNADQPWDVELTDDSNRAEQCRKRRRRFKKRNIAEKVNGTCKQVPTVNKDFNCCETTQQKIQVPGVDREMCLKKEFYYCDSTLQKQGLSCSEGKEEDFKKKSLLQLRPITRFQLQRCCRDVLTACDRKEIHQLCIDCSHETYIAVTVPQWIGMVGRNRADFWTTEKQKMIQDQLVSCVACCSLLLPETSVLYYLTSQLYYQASSDNKAPLWKQHNKKLYC
ncbi:hypothetical protein DPMN_028668 [Dreissena polymorpha]|uniref:Uncharacterized protein n=1 Tax=Dreissena polymorpha TaxID=45954 RepID=A0A9D4LX46_DREPO|nr:hypothetical protein DPMN_028668 [Dreissena polymorpha]